MIIELNYKKGYIDKITRKRFEPKSLLKCDKCGNIREVNRGNILKGIGVKLCFNCHVKNKVGNRKHNLNSYIQLGINKNLTFLENFIPQNNKTKVKWSCNNCKKEIKKSYFDVNNSCGKGCIDCLYDYVKLRNFNPNKKTDRLFKGVVRQIVIGALFQKTKRNMMERVGYTQEQLKNHIQSTWEPWMNWENHGSSSKTRLTWQVDHIKPIQDFIDEGNYNIKEINALSNLRALEAIENIRRYTKRIRYKRNLCIPSVPIP